MSLFTITNFGVNLKVSVRDYGVKNLIQKLEKAEHEYWLKSREMERKVKDAEREYKMIVNQLQVKEAKQAEMEKRIHEINMVRARRRAKAKSYYYFRGVRTFRRLVIFRGIDVFS